MHSAIADLDLDHLFVVHAGPHRFPLNEHVTAISAGERVCFCQEFDGTDCGDVLVEGEPVRAGVNDQVRVARRREGLAKQAWGGGSHFPPALTRSR